MNIFFTSTDPYQCAFNLDDKRVTKMVLETAQMLCTALYEHGGLIRKQNGVNKRGKPKYDYFFKDSGKKAYKPTHTNHPSNIWCRESRANYAWLLAHFVHLATQHESRRGNKHKTFELLFEELTNHINYIPKGDITPFANCAANKDKGLDFKHLPVITAYRKYMVERFKTDTLTPKWTKVPKNSIWVEFQPFHKG